MLQWCLPNIISGMGGRLSTIFLGKKLKAHLVTVVSGMSTQGQAEAIICCLKCYPESRGCLHGILLRVKRKLSSHSADLLFEVGLTNMSSALLGGA